MTLTCDISGGTELQWIYDSQVVTTIIPSRSTFPSPDPVTSSGVEFTVSLLSTIPDLSSQIMFVASEDIQGRMLLCVGRDGAGEVVESITLQVQGSIGKTRVTTNIHVSWHARVGCMGIAMVPTVSHFFTPRAHAQQGVM